VSYRNHYYGSELLLSGEQQAAREHVLAIEHEHGEPHKLNACPPKTLAVCPHRQVIATMRPEDFR